MNDKKIVQMLFDRNPDALERLSEKYNSYCNTIAKNILGNSEDADECINDAYHSVWNSIPPNKPENLAAYIGKIVRNLSFDKYKHLTAEKRGGGTINLFLDELADIVSGNESIEQEIDRKELAVDINAFLNSISKEKRSIFVYRYMYAYPVKEIAKLFGKSEGNISVLLNRTRKGLKEYLTERGYDLWRKMSFLKF